VIDVEVETTLPPLPSPIPPQVTVHEGMDHSQMFKAFSEEKSLIDVVMAGLCDPDEARESWDKYQELKNMDLEIKGRPILEVKVGDLEDQLSDLQQKFQQLSVLSDTRKKEIAITIEKLESTISKLQTDLQGLSKKNSGREKENAINHRMMQDLIDISMGRINGFHSRICPYCRQPAVIVFARCKNCGKNLEKYP